MDEVRPRMEPKVVQVSELPGGRLRLAFEPVAPDPALEQLRVEEARAVLAAFQASFPREAGHRFRRVGTSAEPEEWKRRLREEFVSRYGPPEVPLPGSLETSPVFLALKLSPRYMGEGVREAARELFSSPVFRLEAALANCQGVSQCRSKLVRVLEELADEVCTPGSLLHQLVTKTQVELGMRRMARYFELMDDRRPQPRWHLGVPLDEQGQEIDPWQFKKGEVLELGSIPRFPIDVPGHPLDYCWAAFSIPVIHGRVVQLLEYRVVAGLRIDPAKVGDARIFRPWGWRVALIISEDHKQAMEAEGLSGTRFIEV